MADTTTKGFPYPEGPDPVDVAGDIQALAEAVDDMPGVQSYTGTQIAGLATGAKWAGRVVWNSTTGKLQVSNGSTFSDVDTSVALSSSTPQTLGTAAAGTSSDASRADHRHAMPSASDVGAIGISLVQNSKGALITSTGSAVQALTVGANDTVLTADSATATGLKWAAAPVSLPTQTGNANRFLTTDGTNASWTNLATAIINLAPEERFNVVASAATGTININVLTAAVWYYSTNASANHTINFRGDGSNTLNSLLATGDAITVGWIINNGTTAFYPTTIQIDGSSVTPNWLNGSPPPTSSQANQTAGLDAFTFTIIKTAATPTYRVLGSWAQYR